MFQASKYSESTFEIEPKLLSEVSIYYFSVGNAIKFYYDTEMKSPDRLMVVVKREAEKLATKRTLERLAAYNKALSTWLWFLDARIISNSGGGIYAPLQKAGCVGFYFPTIRNYRSAVLSDSEIVECQNAVAIRRKKKPSQESPWGLFNCAWLKLPQSNAFDWVLVPSQCATCLVVRYSGFKEVLLFL